MDKVKRIDAKFKNWLEEVCNKDQELRLMEKGDIYQAVWYYDEKIDALCSSYGMVIYIALFGGFRVEDNELRFYELDDEGEAMPDEESPYMTFVPIRLVKTEFRQSWNETFGL